MGAGGIFGWLIDSSEAGSINYWMARSTDVSFEDLAPLAKDLEDIYGSVPELARSSFELETTLRAYFRELIGLQRNGSVSVDLDRQNIATGYALFVGSERNLLNYGAYRYHASPSQLEERYGRASQRHGGDGDIYASLENIRNELANGIFDEAEGESDLYLYHYLIYALEESDPRMSGIARFMLERLGRVVRDMGADENRTEHIYFFEKVINALPDLEDLRDGAPQRTADHSPEVKMLLLAFNREYGLFEAFIRFFNALSDKGYFEIFRDFADMPEVARLLEEVADQVLYSRLGDQDRSFITTMLEMMRKGVVEDDRSELDDDIKHRLNSAAWLILNAIKKEWGSGSTPQIDGMEPSGETATAGTAVQPGGSGNPGQAPCAYHAPWMGMMPVTMQAGASVFTAARPMPFLGMPLAVPVMPF